MSQGNLETFVSACAGGSCDNKIVCETLVTTEEQLHTAEESVDVEIPPESFRLSKDAEFHWFDGNAFYQRKESHKGNSASNSTNLNPNLNSDSKSNSQRFPMRTSKASIIGLPKPIKSCFVQTKNRKNTKPGNNRLFPKRPGFVKTVSSVVEPSSPKVSCMGRVRSRRDRNRSLKKNRQNQDGVVEAVKEKGRLKEAVSFQDFVLFSDQMAEHLNHTQLQCSLRRRGTSTSGLVCRQIIAMQNQWSLESRRPHRLV
ncbi:uncharacterized protein LOC120159876 [Hibiscus syriacus]|uniref:uncharacterized protein LOC120159876 n=1 Tax=Hibiscus syriacus TaxID=106335 RepID=UPI0019221735|nr:uncharacterized protein LOC120159876 [Hibiscus syriacus]